MMSVKFGKGEEKESSDFTGTMIICICKFWVLEIVSSLVVAYATFGLLEGFFDHQALFYNAQTVPMSRLEVVEKFVNLEQPRRETHTNKFSYPSSMTQNLTVQPYFPLSIAFQEGFRGWINVLDSLIQIT